MNREQELLIVLSEECGEIVQAVSKIHRFGKSIANQQRLEQEIGDFMGVLKLIVEEGYIDGHRLPELGEQKIAKLEKYMNNKADPDG